MKRVTELLRERFEQTVGIRDGQFFGHYFMKNLKWRLDGIEFGFGDLRLEDIERIVIELKPGEVFEGFHESHGTKFQQLDGPMITITSEGVTTFRDRRKA